MESPETRYARSGDVYVGYQVVGDGPFDLVLIDQWFSNVDGLWRFAPLARLVERLTTFSRVILLDKRGTGVSDPVPLGGLPTLEAWMDDIRAVMDAIGSERAALVSAVGACYLTMIFAATYPKRTMALVLVDGYARITGTDDYFPGLVAPVSTTGLEEAIAAFGTGFQLKLMAPAEYRDPAMRRAFSEYLRSSSSPSLAIAMAKLLFDSDVRQILPAIHAPTLVISHPDSAFVPAGLSRYVAEHIPGARYLELPGSENFLWAGDQARLVAELQEFLTGARPMPEGERVLATVLFTDIVGSTERARTLGDHAWMELLERHYEVARRELERFRGRQVVTTGDGLLATFDGPARAIRCAEEIVVGIRALGLEIRAGLHTGEIELAGSDVRGIAVHIGARIAALAGPGEVLVSSTVKDLVVGSGIEFDDRGVQPLKGIPGEWRLFSVRREAS